MSYGNRHYTRTAQTSCGLAYIETFDKTWSGGNDPKRKIPQPYSMDSARTFSPIFNWSFASRPDIQHSGTVGSCGFAGSVAPPLSWGLDDTAALYSKLARQSYGHSWNGAVFLGELRESLGMIGSTAVVLATSYRHVRKGRVADAWQVLKTFNAKASDRDIGRLPRALHRVRSTDAASHWLQMRYGWRPLLSDVYSAGEAAASLIEFPPPIKVRARRVKKEMVMTGADGSFVLPMENVAEHHRTIILTWNRPPSVAASLGLADPELVAWEWMPYSFVVDWILPIGKYLEARSFAQQFSGTVVQTDLYRRRHRVKGYNANSGIIIHNMDSAQRTQYSYTTMTRSVFSALPSPELPEPRPVLSALTKDVSRTLDAISLLRTAFRR